MGEQLRKIILLTILSLLVLLIGCTSKYDITLSEVSFDHEENIDIVKYVAVNPTLHNLDCELKIRFGGEDAVTDNFEIAIDETKNLSTRVQLPNGETNVVLITRCKPIS